MSEDRWLVQYRCEPRGCLLLEVYATRAGDLLHSPPSRYSADMAEAQAQPERKAPGLWCNLDRLRERAAAGNTESFGLLSCDHVVAGLHIPQLLERLDRAKQNPRRRLKSFRVTHEYAGGPRARNTLGNMH